MYIKHARLLGVQALHVNTPLIFGFTRALGSANQVQDVTVHGDCEREFGGIW